MKIKTLIIIVLIYLAISCKTKKNEGVLLPIGETVVSAEQVCDEGYKETDKKLIIDFTLISEQTNLDEIGLLNPFTSFGYHKRNEQDDRSINIHNSRGSVIAYEEYSQGHLVKRYMPFIDEKFYKYNFLEYDEYGRLVHKYTANDADSKEIANEFRYEYYEDTEGRLYRFEITDSLGCTEINGTSQVIIQINDGNKFYMEEVNETREDLRLLNYEQIHNKLNKKNYTIITDGEKIISIEERENDTLNKYSISYGEDFDNILCQKYRDGMLEYEEQILCMYKNGMLVSEEHTQRKAEEFFSYKWNYSKEDKLGNYSVQQFDGQVLEIGTQNFHETFFYEER